ncbi:MAG: hypothetical protein EP332_07600 [Bacteroidetes bacterium]|nr:MAG: hypothetical protein EP332_07600 [Bacteroidota bacterium]
MNYQQLELHPIRNLVAEQMSLARQTNNIHSLFELDITFLLEKIKEHRRQGHVFSYSTYLMFCLAHSLQEFPEMLDMRLGTKHRIRFTQVDLMTIVERKQKGQASVPMGYIIRDCGRKSLDEITAEIRHAQKINPLDIEGVRERRKLLKLPTFLRKWMLRRIHKDPRKFVQYYGNVSLSSLHMADNNRFWFGIPLSASPLCVVPAGVYKKVVKRDGQFVERDFASFSMTINHDLSDGSPSLRFGKVFADKIENAFGL